MRKSFIFFKNSIRNSKLMNQFQKLHTPATVRNWRTVNKLKAIVEGMYIKMRFSTCRKPHLLFILFCNYEFDNRINKEGRANCDEQREVFTPSKLAPIENPSEKINIRNITITSTKYAILKLLYVICCPISS